MSAGNIALAAVIIVAAVIVIVGVVKAVAGIKRQIGKASRLIDQIQAVTDETSSTPRTLSGSEGLMLMRIKKDFPEFNADVARQIVIGALSKYFAVLNERSGTDRLADCCTDAFIIDLEGQLVNGVRSFSGAKIHKAVISDYRKTFGEAVVTFQAAVEYRPEGKALMQYVYEVKYVYYLSEDNEGENASLICSYCGAPISTVGTKVCEYCGAEIQASVERTWKINSICKIR